MRKGVRCHREKVRGNIKINKRYYKKLRKYFSVKETREMFYRKKMKKIKQYAAYKIYRKYNQKKILESKFQFEGYFRGILNAFSGLGDINYMLEQYYYDEKIINVGGIETTAIIMKNGRRKEIKLVLTQ